MKASFSMRIGELASFAVRAVSVGVAVTPINDNFEVGLLQPSLVLEGLFVSSLSDALGTFTRVVPKMHEKKNW